VPALPEKGQVQRPWEARASLNAKRRLNWNVPLDLYSDVTFDDPERYLLPFNYGNVAHSHS
jgi:hypothetical protein